MMIRLDFSTRTKPGGRTLRVAPQPGDGVTLLAEPGPRLPFRDASVDEVFGGRAFAWRQDIAETLEELWRVCKPGALIHLTLPHASSVLALSRDPRPRPALTLNTFNYYDPRTKPSDGPAAAFALERATLRIAGQRAQDAGLALARGPFAAFIEKLANGSRGSQYRFERWLSGIVAFEEFDVVLAVVKHVEKQHPRQLAREMAGEPRRTVSSPLRAEEPAGAADATDLRVTSDVAHEAANVEPDLLPERQPNAAPVDTGAPYVARPPIDRGNGAA